MPELTTFQWVLAVIAALGIGVSKSGFAGVSLVHVLVMAHIFGDRLSTGVVLPMLVAGDICAVLAFKRHAIWKHVGRTLPIACIGVALGTWLMTIVPDTAYKPFIGWTVLVLVVLQLWRMWKPAMFETVPHSWPFAAAMGMLAGITTMMANAAGPVMGLYFLAVGLPKIPAHRHERVVFSDHQCLQNSVQCGTRADPRADADVQCRARSGNCRRAVPRPLAARPCAAATVRRTHSRLRSDRGADAHGLFRVGSVPNLNRVRPALRRRV